MQCKQARQNCSDPPPFMQDPGPYHTHTYICTYYFCFSRLKLWLPAVWVYTFKDHSYSNQFASLWNVSVFIISPTLLSLLSLGSMSYFYNRLLVNPYTTLGPLFFHCYTPLIKPRPWLVVFWHLSSLYLPPNNESCWRKSSDMHNCPPSLFPVLPHSKLRNQSHLFVVPSLLQQSTNFPRLNPCSPYPLMLKGRRCLLYVTPYINMNAHPCFWHLKYIPPSVMFSFSIVSLLHCYWIISTAANFKTLALPILKTTNYFFRIMCF